MSKGGLEETVESWAEVWKYGESSSIWREHDRGKRRKSKVLLLKPEKIQNV